MEAGGREESQREIHLGREGQSDAALLDLKMEEGTTSKDMQGLEKLEKARKWILPRRPQEECSPAHTLTLAWGTPVSDF